MDFQAREYDPHVPRWLIRMNGWLRDVVDFCYPGLCPGCRSFCPPDQPLCPDCTPQFDALLARPACALCGQAVAYPDAPCGSCRGRGVPHYESILRLCPFETPIRSLIHQLKYHGRWSLGEMLGDRLAADPRVAELLSSADAIVPVPLHRARRMSRGYNQAEVVAGRITRATGVPTRNDVVRRIRDTAAQAHLPSRAKRMKNLRGAFEVIDAAAVTGRRLVVVDDVMTTGATLQTLARALRTARPRRLDAVVIAVAVGTGAST